MPLSSGSQVFVSALYYISRTFHATHWLKNSSFSVKVSVKNFLYFSHIFHWKYVWKIYNFFSNFVKNSKVFQQSQDSSEKVINFLDTFQMKKVWKMKEVFHWKTQWKFW
jgi:hypothetical protein